MSIILRTVMFHLLSRAIGIVVLVSAFAVEGLAENTCAGKASLDNPQASTHSSTGGTIAQSGIGGTGIQDGGIGGTGNTQGGIGGTGIVGIITGFSSICVNGVKIHYNPETPVTIDGRPSTTADLAVGQMAAIRADGAGNEVTARNIAIIHAVVGPVDLISPETGKIQVLDQVIQIHEQSGLENLQIDDWVQVSGHRLSDGTIVASRIEPSQPLAEARINGHVTQIDTDGFIVGGTRIEFDEQVNPSDITLGTEISASGQWNNESLQAQHIQVSPTDQILDRVERVVIEGYVQPINDSEFSLGRQTFKLESDLQILDIIGNDVDQDQLIQASGLTSGESIDIVNIELGTLTSTFIPDVEVGDALHIDTNVASDVDDSSQEEPLGQPEISDPQDDALLSAPELENPLEELNSFDAIEVDEQLITPIDLNAIDELNDLDTSPDIDDDMRHDEDLDWDNHEIPRDMDDDMHYDGDSDWDFDRD